MGKRWREWGKIYRLYGIDIENVKEIARTGEELETTAER